MPPGLFSVNGEDDAIEAIIKPFPYPVSEGYPYQSLQFVWARYGEEAMMKSFERVNSPFRDVEKDYPREICLSLPSFVLL